MFLSGLGKELLNSFKRKYISVLKNLGFAVEHDISLAMKSDMVAQCGILCQLIVSLVIKGDAYCV